MSDEKAREIRSAAKAMRQICDDETCHDCPFQHEETGCAFRNDLRGKLPYDWSFSQ